jgi:ubiquinone/menaquinone biosynthesis C-methylase UbiE
MDKPMSHMGFRVISLIFKLRDFLRPREEILREAEIGTAAYVLDYGCGPGSYTLLAAEMVGPSGRVYALDIHPLAIEKVQKAALKRGLANVETILSDCATGLENGSIDVVLLYDVFHDLGDQRGVLQELHRVLRPNGSISFSDHHMKDSDIVSRVAKTGLFTLARKGEKTHTFARTG